MFKLTDIKAKILIYIGISKVVDNLKKLNSKLRSH